MKKEKTMKFVLSSIMFPSNQLNRAIEFATELNIELEIFPRWHIDAFCRFIKERSSDLRGLVNSFHEPYHLCDHSFPRGTKEFDQTMALCRKTFEAAADIGAKNIVFHHNNRPVTPESKEDMIAYSCENLHGMNEIAKEYGIPYLVENAGVLPWNNVLFDEDSFISLFNGIPNDCLLDIGHAHCNGWDIPRVITALKDRIVAYHIHDNDGTSDEHKLIGEGTLQLEQFKECFKQHTPDATIILEYAEGTEAMAADLKRGMEQLCM